MSLLEFVSTSPFISFFLAGMFFLTVNLVLDRLIEMIEKFLN